MSARVPEEVLRNQRTAAHPDASVWVAANAGSGKTRVLVDRVIRLMLGGAPLARILCLTFTRAAAAEMANRLFKRLAAWTALTDSALEAEIRNLTGTMVPPEQLIEARRLFARALDTPGGLKMQTIHAFCQSLIGRFPLEAGVAPHTGVMDERDAKEALAAARDRVLTSLHDSGDAALVQALDRTVVRVDEDGFDRLMKELSAARGKLRAVEDAGGLALAHRLANRLLGIGASETPESILAVACADKSFDKHGLRAAAGALEAGSDNDRKYAAAIRAWLSDAAARPALLAGDYGSIFLTKDGGPRKTLATQAASAAEEALRAEQERLLAVCVRLKAATVAEASADLLQLAHALMRAYAQEKANRALLDYDDLILKAQDLLRRQGGVSWVLYKLDGGIDHILIDEAQDTSPEQWEVIEALSEEFFAGAGAREELAGPRTVFSVGDEKQSIFSFQGADLAVFEDMRGRFEARVADAGLDFRTQALEYSFRSAPKILEAVDKIFSRDPAAIGVVPPGGHVEHRAVRRGHAGLVEVWPTEKPAEAEQREPWDAPLDQIEADSPESRLARAIARKIKNWIDKKEILESRGRPIMPADIMILVRRRNAFFHEMVRALKKFHIPVAGTDRMKLTEQLAVMDLIAVGKFAALPEDDLTLATVLKSPLYGFDDDDLFRLAYARKGPLWRALKSRAGEDPKWRRAEAELSALLARADYLPPFEFFAELLNAQDGRRRLVARLDHEANDPIDEFLTLAVEYGRDHPPSLQGFIHWLERTDIEIKRDLEHGRGEVRVMTVHGAKGLESPIVFLPDTCSVPDHTQNNKTLWTESGLMLWPVRKANETGACAPLREIESRKRAEEYRRLLYVAMTRAEDRLYVCGYEGAKKPPPECWYNLVRDALEPEAEKVAAEAGVILRLANPQFWEPEDRKGAETLEPAPPLPPWARSAPKPERAPPVPLAPSRPAGEEPPALSPVAARDGAALSRGRIVHRLLELLPPVPPKARDGATRKYLARRVHALDRKAQDAIRAETLAILSDPEFAVLFAPGSRAEVPLAGMVGETIIAGQVDRLAVTPAQVIVVDYKTNRPVPPRPREAPVAYLKQMSAYRALLRRIYPGRKIRCVLLWTAGPKLMPLPDALLDAHEP